MDAEMGFDSLTLIWLARDGGILWSGIHVLLGVVLKVELESFYRLDFVREACWNAIVTISTILCFPTHIIHALLCWDSRQLAVSDEDPDFHRRGYFSLSFSVVWLFFPNLTPVMNNMNTRCWICMTIAMVCNRTAPPQVSITVTALFSCRGSLLLCLRQNVPKQIKNICSTQNIQLWKVMSQNMIQVWLKWLSPCFWVMIHTRQCYLCTLWNIQSFFSDEKVSKYLTI